MSASTILYSLMSSNAQLTGVVGLKIYPQQAPQTTQYPYVSFSIVSNIPTNTKGSTGASTMDRYRVQVTSVGTTQTQIDQIGNLVRNCLDYVFMTTISSTFVQSITFQGELDMFDEGSGIDGLYLKHQDYFLTISR